MAKKSFEEMMEKIETVVGRLENDEVSLEESLKLFEEGVKLLRNCHQRLNEVEGKVQLLVADGLEKPGTEKLEDFDL
jgi:exodeoxyribonuclease VII small subunit